jgi:hypothetical protein
LGKTEATRFVHDEGAGVLFAATRKLLINLAFPDSIPVSIRSPFESEPISM